ncbi:uncharacterized protein TRAVEDRAFT_21430 [Trametes versicolor FP-101664 SS1]|uniref:uncharacterized protein n=1 Tax=Trametes versicolor (strain FP-101664) TaxID=717944 RepID=UPI0004622D7A|nr:uncharacterized protein TRAVEDRAFT_21430 [Trametes versicolor FP-101664 SS1]EIW57992.1 hypothetical protein TRAVEDRAFT_21430 [Trametes versicolor FP-101664 SS1]
MSPMPVIDPQNPFYCPAVPADIYMQDLRFQLSSNPWKFSLGLYEDSKTGGDVLLSFPVRLNDALGADDDDADTDPTPALRSNLAPKNPAYMLARRNRTQLWVPGDTLYEKSRSFSPAGALDLSADYDLSPGRSPVDSPPASALRGPPLRGLSPISLNDESFALSGKADRLRFSMHGHAFVSPDDPKAHGVMNASEHVRLPDWVGSETPRSLAILVAFLESILPGLKLQEKLEGIETTHQNIADVLAVEGRLTARVLGLFRTSEVECLDLVGSMTDEGGLNLGAHDILRTLSLPDGFHFLQELNFSGAVLDDADVLFFNRLPRLLRLWLNNTGISNEAVYHLVALKRTLEEVDLSHNPRVDDDAIPALLTLRKLQFLSLVETNVTMVGMRRLALESNAGTESEDDRRLYVEAPRVVEDYLDDLDAKYLVNPEPPLIVSSAVVPQLSAGAIKRNLAAHGVCNPSISASGTKEEMAERLARILRAREGDLAVQGLLGET